MENNIMDYFKISPGIEEFTQSSFLINLRKTIKKFPNIDFSDSVSRKQIKSKMWLVKNMTDIFGLDYQNIFILCGWYGVLPAIISENKKINFNAIRSIDIDPSCEEIADSINYDLFKEKWKFKSFTSDIYEIDYNNIYLTTDNEMKKINEKADLIINTSCEHLSQFNEWIKSIPKGQKVILQSNNYDLHAQHTNCSDSLNDFIQQCKLNEVLFSGTLPFEDYDRYMVMGVV